jgi:DNA modification methylase
LANRSRGSDIVLDPFGRSGTTLIACEKAGRAAHPLELDPQNCDVVVKRSENATGKKSKLQKCPA